MSPSRAPTAASGNRSATSSWSSGSPRTCRTHGNAATRPTSSSVRTAAGGTRREDEWAARERAAEALDRLADPGADEALTSEGERDGVDDREPSRSSPCSVHRASPDAAEDRHIDIEDNWAMELE